VGSEPDELPGRRTYFPVLPLWLPAHEEANRTQLSREPSPARLPSISSVRSTPPSHPCRTQPPSAHQARHTHNSGTPASSNSPATPPPVPRHSLRLRTGAPNTPARSWSAAVAPGPRSAAAGTSTSRRSSIRSARRWTSRAAPRTRHLDRRTAHSSSPSCRASLAPTALGSTGARSASASGKA
jgi:hypothetical protein